MADKRIKKIVIVGGGTAGWMSAASMARFMCRDFCEVHLIESEDIPTVGVGESTIPQIRVFNQTLGIDEDEFIRRTQGTFKLGIEFQDWGGLGESYMHGFGGLGRNMEALHFHHFWCRMNREGKAKPLRHYALNSLAAPQGKFMRSVEAGDSPLSNIVYAFQFDSGLYALFLREYCRERAVKRTLGTVKDVLLRSEDGFISGVQLEDGQLIEGDLFIDCSGFRGLLIEKALGVGYEDWNHWLPCDRAWALPSERRGPLMPYTTARAHAAGWQWRIPLQHRTGNGCVFSSDFMSDDEALGTLKANLDGEPITEPKLLKFRAGKRENFWEKNCVAIGLSSGFMEPLESTSIHLIQTSLGKLMSFFPDRDFEPINRDYFNRETHFEYDTIRDFLILHYHATRRSDSEFWNYVRTMAIPESLQRKMALFRGNGYVHREGNELFTDVSWAEVFVGQGILPKSYHPLVDNLPVGEIEKRLAHVEHIIASSVEHMPSQEEFIARHCQAPKCDLY